MNNWKNYPCWLPKILPVSGVYERLRKIFGKRGRPASWYNFGAPVQDKTVPAGPFDKAWYRLARPTFHGEKIFYNLAAALQVNPDVKGFAFVFFMGIGDYLYTTPLWEKLKKQFPDIPFYGYVSDQLDWCNSPLVKGLLEKNPCFEKAFFFKGSAHPNWWKNYDYSDAVGKIPDNFLIIPVYYEYGETVSHRVNSVFETFGLPAPEKPLVPVMYFPKEPAEVVKAYLQKIHQKAHRKKGIVFLQLDGRSSNYLYPNVRGLAEKLIQAGYAVLSVTPGGPIENPGYLEIDIHQLSIDQTWQLLAILKQEFPLYMIAVASVSFAASAGLAVPALGLQHWHERALKHLWYPNIRIVTDVLYTALPQEQQILASRKDYRRAALRFDKGFFRGWVRFFQHQVDYEPDFVVRCFEQMVHAK